MSQGVKASWMQGCCMEEKTDDNSKGPSKLVKFYMKTIKQLHKLLIKYFFFSLAKMNKIHSASDPCLPPPYFKIWFDASSSSWRWRPERYCCRRKRLKCGSITLNSGVQKGKEWQSKAQRGITACDTCHVHQWWNLNLWPNPHETLCLSFLLLAYIFSNLFLIFILPTIYFVRIHHLYIPGTNIFGEVCIAVLIFCTPHMSD